MGLYESVAAAVYAYVRNFYGMSLYSCMTDLDVNKRMGYTRGMFSIHFVEMSIRLLTDSSEGGTHFNPICNQPDKEYKQENKCAYNIADAFIQAKRHMVKRYGPDTNEWIYGKMIKTEFTHRIWSSTPLKEYGFSYWVTVPGNHNTIKIAEYGISPDILEKEFRPGKLTEFTMVATMEKGFMSPEKSRYCMYAGLNEFILQGPSYFDFQKGFYDFTEPNLSGRLFNMRYFDDIDGPELELKPDN